MRKTIQQESYHSIVCESPYLQELGLGAFTTGELYNWLTRENSVGDYVNLRLIKNPFVYYSGTGDDAFFNKNEIFLASKVLLGGYDSLGQESSLNSNNYTFTFWNKKDRSGEWIKTSIYGWERKKNLGTQYGPNLPAFNNRRVIIPDYDKISISNNKFEYILQDTLLPPIDDPLEALTFGNFKNLDNVISNIIEINNYVRTGKTIAPEKTWEQIRDANNNDGGLSAYIKLIRDIQSSQEKCIQWSGVVPFIFRGAGLSLDENGFRTTCIKSDWVKYKLYLYERPNNAERKITISNPVIVSPQSNPIGVIGQIKGGEIQSTLSNPPPSQQIAAPIKFSYDEINGRFESGTQQVMAVMTTDVEAASTVALEDIQEQPIEEYLLRSDISHQVFTGSAIPLFMHNTNPLQWGPIYDKTSGCRNNDNSKKHVKVYNIYPTALKVGQHVLMQQLNGVWVPVPVNETPETADAKFVGNWDFSYLMTNSRFYFTSDTGVDNVTTSFSPKQYETNFYSKFYTKIANNLSYKDEYLSTTLVTSENLKIDPEGYLHVTSWDFMRQEFGGTRETRNTGGEGYNAINLTAYGLNRQGESDGRDPLPPYLSAPFFGCVFPDGYNETEVLDLYNFCTNDNNNTQIKATGLIYNDGSNKDNFYLKPIDKKIKVFEDKNANIQAGENSVGGPGIFSILKTNNGLFRMPHLPADIALNSPSQETSNSIFQGSPITNHKAIFKYLSCSDNNLDTEQFFKQSDKYSWFYKGTNPSAPMWNLTPNFPNKIQFRPLRIDTYASFDGLELNFFTNGLNLSNSNASTRRLSHALQAYGEIVGDTYSDAGYGAFYNKMVLKRSQVTDKARHKLESFRPVYAGEFYQTPINGFDIQNNHIQNGKPFYIGLSRGSRDMRQVNDGNNYLDFTQTYDDKDSGNFPWPVFNSQTGYESEKPPLAVGIIGASAKFRLRKSLIIRTSQFMGFQSKNISIGSPVEYSAGVFLGALGGVGMAPNGGGESSRLEPMWGRNNDEVQSFNTTAMFIRVFVSWPKHLTVYDARFFAVHHFNYGAGKLKEKEEEVPEVDLKWPTDSNGNLVTDFNRIFFSDSSLKPKTEWKIRHTGNPNDWLDGKNRRGKLLPYRYKKFSIGIGVKDHINEEDYNNSEEINIFMPESNKKVEENTTGILLINGGSNYQIGDKLTTSGGAGNGVEIEVTNTNDGKITELTVISPGKDFFNKDFMSIGDPLDDTGISNVRLINKEVQNNGAGIVAYIISGRLVSSFEEDKKPNEVVTAKQISLPSENGTGGDRGIIKGDLISEFPIDQSKKSPNNEYDIFIHYHNDCSHVGQKDVGGSPYFEQHITLEIGAAAS